VLQLISEGFTNKQIGSELHLSQKTVEKHRNTLMKKLNIHNIAGLTRHAVAKGITEIPLGKNSLFLSDKTHPSKKVVKHRQAARHSTRKDNDHALAQMQKILKADIRAAAKIN